MKLSFAVTTACLLLASAAHAQQPLDISLICDGEGEKPGVENKYSYSWDDDDKFKRKTTTEMTTERYDGSVTVEVSEGRYSYEGRIKLDRKMIPPIHSGDNGGWWTLENIKVSDDEIVGQYKVNFADKPKLVINRRSGRISIDGLGHFHGSCDVNDNKSRRF